MREERLLDVTGFSAAVRATLYALAKLLPTVLGVALLNFFLLQLLPGDAADVMASESGAATEQSMAAWRHQYGLDLSLPGRFGLFVKHLLHFDLGQSPRFGVSVATLIGQRLPNTLLLMMSALTVAVLLGVLLGTVMAVFARRLPDRILSVLALIFYSVPGFWLGLMLIVLFSVKLGWLPSGGPGAIGMPAGPGYALDKARHLALPATALALIYVGTYARLTRAAMLETIHQDYVRTATAKGLHPLTVIWRHALRNALVPVTTMAGSHVAGLLGGAVVVETVFNWPGLGSLAYDAVMGRDFNLLLGILLISSLVVIAANAGVDIAHLWLDPRLRRR